MSGSQLLLGLALLAGCQPEAALPIIEGCLVDTPPDGQVYVQTVQCSDAVAPGGEGRGADWLIAHEDLRAIVRHPLEGLSLAGIGGGTLVDLSHDGSVDLLHEAIPIIDGGWMSASASQATGRGVRVNGDRTSLPTLSESDTTGPLELDWSLPVGSPWLELEGADALWVHPRGIAALRPVGLQSGDAALAWRGTIAEDFGGAVLLEGPLRLTAGTAREVLKRLSQDVRTITGSARGADSLSLYAGGELTWTLPLDADQATFTEDVPTWVDEVAATGSGRRASPRAAVDGATLNLDLGASGTLVIDDPPPFALRLILDDGSERRGFTVVPGTRATLLVPPGSWQATFSRGVVADPLTVNVTIPPDGTAHLSVPYEARHPKGWALAETRSQADRSHDWRGSDLAALRNSARSGAAFTVLSPAHTVSGLSGASNASVGDLRWRNGSLGLTEHGTISSWPHAANSRYSGHGAPPSRGEPRDLLAAHWGGAGSTRITEVDADFLASLGPLAGQWPRPDLVRLDGPFLPAALVSAYDATVPLTPTGPATWLWLAGDGSGEATDYERALLRGHAVATTGPHLAVTVDGQRPGQTSEAEDPELVWTVASQEPLHNVAVVGTGGEVLGHWSLRGETSADDRLALPRTERWVVVTAWSDDEQHWAVSAPIWLRTP